MDQEREHADIIILKLPYLLPHGLTKNKNNNKQLTLKNKKKRIKKSFVKMFLLK